MYIMPINLDISKLVPVATYKSKLKPGLGLLFQYHILLKINFIYYICYILSVIIPKILLLHTWGYPLYVTNITYVIITSVNTNLVSSRLSYVIYTTKNNLHLRH